MPNHAVPFITPDAMLAHWLGHRRLTRRIIDAYPEDQLYTFSIGGMRPFGVLVAELLGMGAPMVRGVVTDKWEWSPDRPKRTKAELLRLWDEGTAEIERLWPQIPPSRFQEVITAFGQYTDVLHVLLMYVIDNEIHHRGQASVYLRALGIEPPAFYDRS
ncbi:MAG TPA: DinB family protein [Vicinamibacterales bacterium]